MSCISVGMSGERGYKKGFSAHFNGLLHGSTHSACGRKNRSCNYSSPKQFALCQQHGFVCMPTNKHFMTIWSMGLCLFVSWSVDCLHRPMIELLNVHTNVQAWSSACVKGLLPDNISHQCFQIAGALGGRYWPLGPWQEVQGCTSQQLHQRIHRWAKTWNNNRSQRPSRRQIDWSWLDLSQ